MLLKPGWRTLKTAISVLLCVLVMRLVFHIDNPMIACLSSVFALREEISKAYSFGISRIIGNACGGFLALLAFSIQHVLPLRFIPYILPSLCVIIFIQTMNIIHNQAGIISGMAAFFMIFFSIPAHQSFHYVIFRIMETFIGVLIAILVNHIIKPPQPKQRTLQDIEADIKRLENERETLLHKD